MWGAACWLIWAGREPLSVLCLVLSMCDCTERRMGPGERETNPFGMQPHKEFADCGTAEVAQLGPCNQYLVLRQWIFTSVFYSCLLSCTLFCYFGISAWQKCCCSVLWAFLTGKDPAGHGLGQSDQDVCRRPQLCLPHPTCPFCSVLLL